MNRLPFLLLLMLSAVGSYGYAHDGFEHARGVVKAVSDYSVTIELDDKTTRVLALTPRTTIRKDRKRARVKDLIVGDRVVIEVPNGSTKAAEVEVEPPKRGDQHTRDTRRFRQTSSNR